MNNLLDNNEGFVDCEKITGIDYIDKIIDIDQSPIGRTPRSNPITYTGIFSLIREELQKNLNLNQEVTLLEDLASM